MRDRYGRHKAKPKMKLIKKTHPPMQFEMNMKLVLDDPPKISIFTEIITNRFQSYSNNIFQISKSVNDQIPVPIFPSVEYPKCWNHMR
jgi:hypothetical protein